MENSIFNTPTFIYNGVEYPSAVAVVNKFQYDLLLGLEANYIDEAWDGEEIINFLKLYAFLDIDYPIAVHPGDFHADELYCIALYEEALLSGEKVKQILRTRERKDVAGCVRTFDTCEGSGDHHGLRADRAHAVCAFSRFVRLLYASDEIRSQQPQEFWEALGRFANMIALQDTGYLIFDEVAFVHHQSHFGTISGEDRFQVALDMVRADLHARMQAWAAKPKAEQLANEIIAANPNASVLVFPKECRAADVKELVWKAGHPALYLVSWQAEGDWRIICAATPKEQDTDVYNSRSSRFLLPESWSCKRGQTLVDETKIDEAIFCHADRWIAAWHSQEGATQAAELAVKALTGEV